MFTYLAYVTVLFIVLFSLGIFLISRLRLPDTSGMVPAEAWETVFDFTLPYMMVLAVIINVVVFGLAFVIGHN